MSYETVTLPNQDTFAFWEDTTHYQREIHEGVYRECVSPKRGGLDENAMI